VAQRAEAAAPRVLAEAKADVPNLSVQVLEVTRSGRDTLTVVLYLVNSDGPGVRVALGSAFAAEARDAGTLADAYLWAPPGRRKYYVMRDDDDRPVCSGGLEELAAGERRRVWMTFPGPPPGVDRITICLPHVPPIENVPIG
jgi:hypothetical protein